MKIADYENKKTEILNSNESPEQKSLALTSLSQQIRRCAWRGPFNQIARDLARDCDEAAAKFAGSAVNPAPRFDAFVSGGIIHRAIK